jgi:hypothetical protein
MGRGGMPPPATTGMIFKIFAGINAYITTTEQQTTTHYNIVMVNIRMAEVKDLIEMQQCNLWCLPENYQMK